ncbi:MAG: DUF1573 domain-containing protein [Bacteroidota bacterium]
MIKYFSLMACFGIISAHTFSQGVVVNSNPTMNDRFSKKTGSMRLSSTIVKIGKIRNNETKSDTLKIFNDGARDLSISPGKVPAHLQITVGTPTLAPKAESWIAIVYDGAKRNDFGFVIDRFELITNDTIQPKKLISVSANILEFFAPMTGDDSANIQKAKWIETTYDYGRIKQGSKITHNFSLTNTGKRDLYVRKTKSSCGCLKTSATTDTIASGATGYITIEFDSYNKEGKDSRKMSVFLNDPEKPEVVLELKGEIEK